MLVMSVEALTLKDAKGNIFTAPKVLHPKTEVGPKVGTLLTSYHLADGRTLNYDVVSDTFEIAATGERLVRVLR
jgi:hypothetical protein